MTELVSFMNVPISSQIGKFSTQSSISLLEKGKKHHRNSRSSL